EEVLIDFQELVGENSGENMALSMWKTLELYSLKGWIQAIVADNASNNDTMMEALSMLCAKEGILFSAHEAWIPHTVHLAALKVRSWNPSHIMHTLIFPLVA
ncbi:hypothetical protein JB92DRAFT_3200979, partial [Gautieria morchelliformis]